MKTYADKKKQEQLVKHLKKTGYVSYAVALQKIGLKFTDEEGVIGYTTPRGIVINELLNDSEMGLVARHEVLHNLLGHLDNKTWGKGRDNPELRNIAGDLELSHYYDDLDSSHFNAGGAISGGLNVHRRNNAEYFGMDCIEIYDKMIEDGEAKGDSLGDCVQADGEAQKGAKAFDKPGPKLDKKEKDELLEGIKSDRQERYERKQLEERLRKEVELDPEVELFYSLNRYFVLEQRMQRNKSYRRPNKKYAGSIVKKGVTRKQSAGKTLVVYVDRSGSMSEEKTGRAESILKNTISRLKNVTVITKYFADDVYTSGNITGGTNYAAVINDIIYHKYLDVAIVTDNDYDGGGNVADLDAVWLVSVERGHKTNIADRFNASLLVESEVSQ